MSHLLTRGDDSAASATGNHTMNMQDTAALAAAFASTAPSVTSAPGHVWRAGGHRFRAHRRAMRKP